jgi:hypothetical protein
MVLPLVFSVLPRSVSVLRAAEPFSANRDYTLECRSEGSRPPATLTWWKRGKFMGKAAAEEVSTAPSWTTHT